MTLLLRLLDDACHRSPWPRRYGLVRYYVCQARVRREGW